jgi:hypothetical protein
MSICNDSNSAILSIDQPAKLSWTMGNGVPGSLDGIILRPGGSSTWKACPNNTPLLKGRFFVPQGWGSMPLKCEEMYQTIPRDSMFMFARNVASPYCKSTYSTFGGQVCTNSSQQAYVGERRGGNNDFPGDGAGF